MEVFSPIARIIFRDFIKVPKEEVTFLGLLFYMDLL